MTSLNVDLKICLDHTVYMSVARRFNVIDLIILPITREIGQLQIVRGWEAPYEWILGHWQAVRNEIY